ncbi:uncharacterized protein VTP21DRAFT_11753 [Calcarisporiella thermophila]|uniref:uncharacterized protein n=1 Tax=Calcarisporiella thermophila TaxID=911321 RepID=UPI0037432049
MRTTLVLFTLFATVFAATTQPSLLTKDEAEQEARGVCWSAGGRKEYKESCGYACDRICGERSYVDQCSDNAVRCRCCPDGR